MPSFSQTIVLGHLGKDPETRYTKNGKTITSLSIATSQRWKDKSGEWQEETEWHRCVLYGDAAARAGEYLQKGDLVQVVGQNKTSEWTDKDGVKRYMTEIKAFSYTQFTKHDKTVEQQSFEDDIPF